MFMFLENWHEILPRDGGHVVSVFGGGGKTSLLEAMCDVLVDEGVPVCVTTTTRTEPLDWAGLVVLEHTDLLAGTVAPAGAPVFVRAGVNPSDGKWLGLGPADVDALGGLLPGHVVLVEADGSAGLPAKLHNAHDPDLPARTSLAVPVLGLSALGGTPEDVLHRYGRVSDERLELVAGEPLAWDHLLNLLARPDGYLGRIAAHVPVMVALLQMDENDDAIGLFEAVGGIMDDLDVPVVLLGDTSGPEPRLRTACRVDDGDGGAGAEAT
jgi:probable selenium-dependent hydroxylase accessory protein YqeC